jgi:membrane fusion protein (multidrug efflux system)
MYISGRTSFPSENRLNEASMANNLTANISQSSAKRQPAALYAVTTLSVMAFLFAGCEKPAAPPPPPPTPVSVLHVQQSDVALSNEWVGTLDGNVNAQIQPQVSGYLIQQTYREGSNVTQGQVLFEIDPRPFQAVVNQAAAQLEQAKAAYGLTQTNVNRDTPLVAAHAIAQSQLDTEKAQMAQAEATVKSAEASLNTAQLNLEFTHVRSLISGVAGQATTQVGNLVSPQSVLTSVSQLNPIRVYFSLSDSEYLALVGRLKHGGDDLLKSSDAVPLKLKLSDGSIFPHQGRIVFVDRQMNQQTGAIRVAATFPNPDNVLRPGQFGRVSANTEVAHNAILVPQAAVTDFQGQKQLYTVAPGNTVHVVNVTVGAVSGPNIVILSGLAPGTDIITDNLQKLREGAPINPHAAAPAGGN